MTLLEAIRIKKHYQYILPGDSYPDLIEADNLSIGALEAWQFLRSHPGMSVNSLLPGETEE